MESLQVGGGVEALELRRVQSLQPGHVERRGHIVSRVVAGVESTDDRRQGGLAVGAADRLEEAVVTRDRGIAVTGGGDSKPGGGFSDVRHIAGDREQNVMARGDETGLEAGERARVALAV